MTTETIKAAKGVCEKNCLVYPLAGSKKAFKAVFKSGEERVIRLLPSIEDARKIRAVQEFLTARGVCVPRVFSIKASGRFFFVEMEFARGNPASSEWRKLGREGRETVIRQAAKEMVKLHSLKPGLAVKKSRLWLERKII